MSLREQDTVAGPSTFAIASWIPFLFCEIFKTVELDMHTLPSPAKPPSPLTATQEAIFHVT